MHVLRYEQYENTRHKRIFFAVYDVYAGSVHGGSKFPIAVAVQHGVVVPQKSDNFVGLQFRYDFFDYGIVHNRIVAVAGGFVNV